MECKIEKEILRVHPCYTRANVVRTISTPLIIRAIITIRILSILHFENVVCALISKKYMVYQKNFKAIY